MKTDLIDRFIGFTHSNRLFKPDDQVIIALSGGGDSVALVDLFSRLNQKVILAHCNFKLRGQESDDDEDFVRKISIIYDLPLHVKVFPTREYSMEKGISIEMAARELRYAWFEEVRLETESSCVAVAHHADDSIETMFINLIRGTGIRGLAGIQPRHGNVIRPLLFTNRPELIDYLEYRHLEYRHDSSNQDIHFIRNRIRQVILPEIEKINPSFRQIVQQEQLLFSQAQGIIDGFASVKGRELMTRQEDQSKINIRRLKEEEFCDTILYELLRPFGFNGKQIKPILASAGLNSGRVFESKTHTLLIDREEMIIAETYSPVNERFYLDPDQPDNDLPLRFDCRILSNNDYRPSKDSDIACLDYEKLDLPLILRRWEYGDFFSPFGMESTKKVSDFFIDQKVNRIDKSRAWILASGEKIVWIVGYRIDNRFRISSETTEILEIKVSM
jgi:tRNA(Ile)-lysidine synthase